ncbi:hypothetical protein B0H13DRAFT_1655569, partial [Mycena leptocephala]
GINAPKDCHPNTTKRDDVSRVNHKQRAPLPSKEMKDEPEETELLSEFIKLITIIIEKHLKKLLPEEYDQIQVYASQLPLNQRSHAHPFGGFVLNIAVSTKCHRDEGDKIFCVVIPFGEWTGGELGFVEPGLLFRLRAWDAIILHLAI